MHFALQSSVRHKPGRETAKANFTKFQAAEPVTVMNDISFRLYTSLFISLLWTSDQPVAEASTQDNTTCKHKRQTSMPRAGFEPAIPALDRAATGIGSLFI
jgi:hypothetical protein